MPKARSKPYTPGETFSVYIPPDIDKRTLKFINSHKFISPACVELLKEKAKQLYPNFEEQEEKESKKNE